MFFTRDEVFQWLEDSRERLLGLSPKQAEEKSDSEPGQDETPAQD